VHECIAVCIWETRIAVRLGSLFEITVRSSRTGISNTSWTEDTLDWVDAVALGANNFMAPTAPVVVRAHAYPQILLHTLRNTWIHALTRKHTHTRLTRCHSVFCARRGAVHGWAAMPCCPLNALLPALAVMRPQVHTHPAGAGGHT
jgi:hypothetical protein